MNDVDESNHFPDNEGINFRDVDTKNDRDDTLHQEINYQQNSLEIEEKNNEAQFDFHCDDDYLNATEEDDRFQACRQQSKQHVQ